MKGINMKILLILAAVLALIININADPFNTNDEKLNELICVQEMF